MTVSHAVERGYVCPWLERHSANLVTLFLIPLPLVPELSLPAAVDQTQTHPSCQLEGKQSFLIFP